MHIYSRYKSYKNPPFLTKQRVFLVRPMRFERTAFGVGVPIKRIKVIKIAHFASNRGIYMQLKFSCEKLVHLVSDR